MPEKYKSVTAQFPMELVQRVEREIARNRELTFSAMIRTLVREGLDARSVSRKVGGK